MSLPNHLRSPQSVAQHLTRLWRRVQRTLGSSRPPLQPRARRLAPARDLHRPALRDQQSLGRPPRRWWRPQPPVAWQRCAGAPAASHAIPPHAVASPSGRCRAPLAMDGGTGTRREGGRVAGGVEAHRRAAPLQSATA
eukprot:scaffold98994_cov63-Phaeocystis_antarctica.AAC.4